MTHFIRKRKAGSNLAGGSKNESSQLFRREVRKRMWYITITETEAHRQESKIPLWRREQNLPVVALTSTNLFKGGFGSLR